MKEKIIQFFSVKACMWLISIPIFISLILVAINFNQMAMPYYLLIAILTLCVILSIFSYLGFVTKIILTWETPASARNLDSIAYLVALSLVFSISLFICLGMILPSLD